MTDPEHAATLTRPGDKIGRATPTPSGLTDRLPRRRGRLSALSGSPVADVPSFSRGHTQFCVMLRHSARAYRRRRDPQAHIRPESNSTPPDGSTIEATRSMIEQSWRPRPAD